MKILFLILIILCLWLYTDFKLGRKKQKKQAQLPPRIRRESNIDFFASGPEFFHDYFSMLKKAKRHIHIMFYIVKDDRLSKEFMDILADKARSGVEVRLLLDWAGSFPMKKNMVKQLQSQGIQVLFSNAPKLPFLFFSLQARNHRKITVIDGEIGYIGGFNVGMEYINQDPKLSPWRDYHLKLLGEGVADLQQVFLTDWRQASQTNLLDNMIYFPQLEKGAIQHEIIPTDGFLLEEQFSALFRNATFEIIIGTPYFIPSPRLMNDLTAALKRGIDIKILVPKKSDHILVKEASFVHLRKLIKQGASVFEYENGFYHAKIMIIDRQICDIGTANFDKRSLYLNGEVNCYIFDNKLISSIKAVIDKDIEHAKRLTLKELNGPNPFRLCKEAIARSVSSLL